MAIAPASNKRWYIVHAYSGMEKAVERNLRERIDRAGMQDKFGRILVPTEEVVELKNGKKTPSPSAASSPATCWSRWRWPTTPGTWSSTPARSPASSAARATARRRSPRPRWKIVSQMQEGIDKPRPKVEWTVGELVRVKEGPFTDFNGAVEEVNYEKSKVRVSVTIFGRATPVELDFAQVEKV
jgi:transcriptional antiterminator NusG